MKNLLLIIFLLLTAFYAKGQLICYTAWPPENLRPDTITTYQFSHTTISTKKIATAKPLSNFGFQAPGFKTTWIPVNTLNLASFIKNSITGFEKPKLLDTLYCTLFGKIHTAILFKSKKKTVLLIYQDKTGNQDIFLATGIKKHKPQKVLDFINVNLQE